MDYLSSKQTSLKWKISSKRVIVLCKQGKIMGAKKIGHSWLIPSNSTKPLDARYKQNVKDLESSFNQNYMFKFPLYAYSVSENPNQISSLTQEEKIYIEAEKTFHSNKMNESYDTFIHIYETTKNPCIKMGSLYYIVFTNLLRQDFELFDKFYNELTSIVKKYENKYPSIKYIVKDIDYIKKGNVSFDSIEKEELDTYHKSSYGYLSCLEFYKNVFFILSDKGNTNLSFYEMICSNYENNQYFFVAQTMHILLAIMYRLLKQEDKIYVHLDKALDIAQKHNIYSVISQFANYLIDYLDEALKKYPSEISNIIDIGNTLYVNAVNAIAIRHSGKNIKTLHQSDYRYIAYAFNKMSNKEIAINLKISEARVSEKYAQICHKFNVYSKQQLIEALIKNIANPYLIVK